MTNTEIVNQLSEVRYSNPNSFYDRAQALASITRMTRQEIIDLYNDAQEEEED